MHKKRGDADSQGAVARRHMSSSNPRGPLVLVFPVLAVTAHGRRFNTQDMMAVADDERLPVDEASVWTFANGGPGMAMPHPIHIHGVRFRIIERSSGHVPADLRDGVIDAGFKDVFGIFPGERVRVLLAPSEPGLFMYHCHNLEHEDGGMMRNCMFGPESTAKG